ncbi:MAG TPA: 4-hydroxy-tetrahydrodipicolinate reductase [Acidimicrobiales bacterium]|nr:4-hydroxy-tetrahydrodipicolinate reductase [Acidimicrobiales bacterium]
MIRVAVFGAGGRMGATTCAAVTGSGDLELVAAVDPHGAGRPLAEVAAAGGASVSGRAALIEVAGHPDEIAGAGADVAVDFTVATAARANLRWCAEHSVHAVCGTTGLAAADLAELEELFAGSGANCVVAANFSVGATLMIRCAELCAPYLDGVEIVELHHDRKRDAPSGTSLETARRIEAARAASGAAAWREEPTETAVLAGTRGGTTAGGVQIHSVRLPGLVAHQEVIFGSLGETLTLRHDSTDRSSFMPGVLLAVRRVAGMPGVTVGLEPLLGLTT